MQRLYIILAKVVAVSLYAKAAWCQVLWTDLLPRLVIELVFLPARKLYLAHHIMAPKAFTSALTRMPNQHLATGADYNFKWLVQVLPSLQKQPHSAQSVVATHCYVAEIFVH